MIFQTEQISYTELLVRGRWDIYPLKFQLIPLLVTMSTCIPLLQIFVNIHLRITYLRTSNGAPVMVVPVTIVKRKLLYMPTFYKWSLVGGLFSLTLLRYLKLFLPLLFSSVSPSLSVFILFGGTI